MITPGKAASSHFASCTNGKQFASPLVLQDKPGGRIKMCVAKDMQPGVDLIVATVKTCRQKLQGTTLVKSDVLA